MAELNQRLEEQAVMYNSRLDDQASKLTDQASKLTDQASKLADQASKLTDQASRLATLERLLQNHPQDNEPPLPPTMGPDLHVSKPHQ